MRHEQLLGQTLPCPKCKESITVPIHPPAPAESTVSAKPAKPSGTQAAPTASRVGGQIIDSTAMTKVGDVDWDDLLAGGDPSTRPVSSAESGPKFRPLNEPDFIPIPSTYTPSSTSASVSGSDLDKAIHRQTQRSIDNAKRRQMLILAAIGITGSLMAVGCFVIFIQMVGNKPQPIANGPSGIATEPKSTDKKVSNPEINNSEPSVPPVQETIVIPPSAPLVTDEIGANESPATTSSKKPNVPPNTSADMTPAVPTPVQPNPSDSQSAPATTPSAQGNDEASISSPPIFSIFKGVLLQENVGNSIVEPSSDRAELNIENAPDIQKQVFHPDPKPYPVWAEKSNLAFSSFRQKEISLLRCIDLFGRMTGVGITVDWQSCRVAGIDLSKKIEIDEKDKTIAELVSQLLLANGLEWSLDTNGLPIVSAPKAAMEAKSQLDWPISGLFQMGAERDGCEALIRLWEYQDVCSFADGRLLWNEQATPIQKANMQASLCELATLQRLEAKPWSEPQESPLIFSPNYWNRSLVALERKTRLTLEAHERRPIPDLLMTAAAETQLNLVIDWQNVWRHGLTPTSSAAIVLGGRTFPQTAKRFLTDYALEIVPILDDTVLLTTREARRSLIRIIPLRMPKSTKLDDLRQYLRSLAPLEAPLVNNRTKFKIVPIPGTDDLFFARICSPSSEQLNDPDIVLGLGWPERP